LYVRCKHLLPLWIVKYVFFLKQSL